MTRLTGEFRFDVGLVDAVEACAEAIEHLGWLIKSLEANRIVSYAITAPSQHPPKIELDLSPDRDGTNVRITGSDTAPNQTVLVAELDRVRNAISEAAAQIEAPAEGVPQGWYDDPRESGLLRYWDGQAWTDHSRRAVSENVPQQQLMKAAAESSTPPAHTKKSDGRGSFPRPHWRKMTWVLIIWTLIFTIWVIGGVNSTHCDRYASDLNQNACQAGTGIGVGIVIFLWFLGFVVLSLIWFMTRPKGRECPACGERVKKGRTVCPGCGHDFAAAAGRRAVASAAPS